MRSATAFGLCRAVDPENFALRREELLQTVDEVFDSGAGAVGTDLSLDPGYCRFPLRNAGSFVFPCLCVYPLGQADASDVKPQAEAGYLDRFCWIAGCIVANCSQNEANLGGSS